MAHAGFLAPGGDHGDNQRRGIATRKAQRGLQLTGDRGPKTKRKPNPRWITAVLPLSICLMMCHAYGHA